MSAPPFAEQIPLRAAIAAVERAIREPAPDAESGETKDSTTALHAAWGALVKLLAIGPAPILRDCQYCGQSVMRDATRCRECSRKLAPLTTATALIGNSM
jgi:hypothetical protein